MSSFFKLVGSITSYKSYTLLGILFHILTAILTVLSIPLVIPFFQILFGISPSDYQPAESLWDLEGMLNYGFSRLIAMTDHMIALKVVCIAVVIVFLLKNLCRYLTSFFMIYVRNGLLRDLRFQIWQSYEELSLQQRYDHQKGSLISLITNDLSEVDHGILKVFEMLFKSPLVIVGSFIFMIWLSPQLTIIAFCLILFTLVVIGGVSQALKKNSAIALSSLSIMTILVDQYLSAMKLVKTHHADGFFSMKFTEENERYFKMNNKILRRRDLASPLAEFLGVTTIVILLYYGTHAVFNQDMEAATFFAFIFAFYNIIDPAKSFSREYANIQRGMAALDRINSFIGHTELTKNEIESISDLSFNQALEMKDVSFKYTDGHPVLESISLKLNKGEKIGLVGLSGTGKTTILDLFLNFYQPQKGEVTLDNVDINTYTNASYRSIFGLATQQPSLFYGTVEENILLDREKDAVLLNDVLAQVGLDRSFAEKAVGDDATKISGGEAQRISLARLLYRKPLIYLLDEPTAHLDKAAQVEIMSTIHQITEDKTVLLITHQIELLKKMDQIILLDQHRIIDIGQYQALYERNVLFRRLVGL